MSDSAKKYTIAVIPGDGIGKEVTPWAQKALEKAAEGVAEFDYENFDLGAERYLRDGAILPEEEEERIKKTIDEVKEMASGHGGFARTKWCGSLECELKMKEQAGVSSRCMPLKQSGTTGKCVCCGKECTTDIYWGVAY